MPEMGNDQFMLEYNLPAGQSIYAVEKDILEIQAYVQKQENINFVTAAIGRPPARYTLMRYMPTGGENYGELIIEAKDIEDVDALIPQLRQYITENYPDAEFRIHKYGAAFSDYDVEVEFSGPDPEVLRQLGKQAIV